MKKNDEYVIEVENVYKDFNVYYDRTNTLKERLLFWKSSRKEKREILKGITLRIRKGEVVGLIGVNRKWKIYIIEINDPDHLSKQRDDNNQRKTYITS